MWRGQYLTPGPKFVDHCFTLLHCTLQQRATDVVEEEERVLNATNTLLLSFQPPWLSCPSYQCTSHKISLVFFPTALN